MNELLPSLGGVALFAAAGLGLAELFPGLRALPLSRRLGYAYLLGIACVAGSLWALSHFLGIPLRRPAIWGTAALPAMAGLAAWAIRRTRGTVAAPRGRPTLPGLAVAAVLALICLGLFVEAITNPIANWDSRMIWANQAIYLRAEGTVNASVLRQPRWYIDHPTYPLLLPLAQVAVMEGFAEDRDRHIFRAFYAALFPAFLLVLWDGARRWAGRVPAALACLAAAGVPAVTFWGDGGAASGYSDLPLACFFGAGLVLLLRSRRRISDGFAAGLLLGGAVLSKNEGALLALAALAIGGIGAVWSFRRMGRAWKAAPLLRLAAAAAPLALALALFLSWRSGIPNRHDEKYASFVDLGDFWPEVVTRIPLLAPVIAEEMSSWDVWLFFWWIAPVVLLAGWRGWRGRRWAVSCPLLLGLASPIAVVWGAYTVHWEPVYLAPVTWNRFLVQASLPLFLLLSLSLRDLLRRGGAQLAYLLRRAAPPSRSVRDPGTPAGPTASAGGRGGHDAQKTGRAAGLAPGGVRRSP